MGGGGHRWRHILGLGARSVHDVALLPDQARQGAEPGGGRLRVRDAVGRSLFAVRRGGAFHACGPNRFITLRAADGSGAMGSATSLTSIDAALEDGPAADPLDHRTRVTLMLEQAIRHRLWPIDGALFPAE